MSALGRIGVSRPAQNVLRALPPPRRHAPTPTRRPVSPAALRRHVSLVTRVILGFIRLECGFPGERNMRSERCCSLPRIRK